MNGLRAIIRNKMPESWEHVLRQEHKLTAFIEYVYRDQPVNFKGKYGYQRGKENIIVGYKRCPLTGMFAYKNTKEGHLFWKRIEAKIKWYEYNCL